MKKITCVFFILVLMTLSAVAVADVTGTYKDGCLTVVTDNTNGYYIIKVDGKGTGKWVGKGRSTAKIAIELSPGQHTVTLSTFDGSTAERGTFSIGNDPDDPVKPQPTDKPVSDPKEEKQEETIPEGCVEAHIGGLKISDAVPGVEGYFVAVDMNDGNGSSYYIVADERIVGKLYIKKNGEKALAIKMQAAAGVTFYQTSIYIVEDIKDIYEGNAVNVNVDEEITTDCDVLYVSVNAFARMEKELPLYRPDEEKLAKMSELFKE